MCFGLSSPKTPAAAPAPPAPEAVPESVAPVDDTIRSNRKRNKGISGYRTDINPFTNFGDTGSGLNVPR